MAGELEVRMNSVLVSGRKDGTLTYTEYVKDRESGKSAKEELDGHEGRLTAAENDIDSLEAKQKAMQTTVEGHGTTLADHETRLHTAETRIVSAANTASKQQTTLNDHEKRITKAETDIAALGVEKLETEVEGLKTDTAGLKTDVSGLKTEVAAAKTALEGKASKEEFEGLAGECELELEKRPTEDAVKQKVQDGEWLPIKAGRDDDGNVVEGAVVIAGATEAKATGLYSHAEGHSEARGQNSHAEGETMARGGCSHSEGVYSYALGEYSHVECAGNIAHGVSSHSEGYGTIAKGAASHAEGHGNYPDEHFISTTGVGELGTQMSDENYTDVTNPKGLNARAVYVGRKNDGIDIDLTDPHNGHSYFLGIGGYKGQAVEDGMKSLQEVIGELPTTEEVAEKVVEAIGAEIDDALAVKADLEDGNVPTAQLGNVAAIVDERIKAKAEESSFSVRFAPKVNHPTEGGTLTIDGQAREVKPRTTLTYSVRVPTTLEMTGNVTWLDTSKLDTSKLTRARVFGNDYDAYYITSMDVSHWDTLNMTDMSDAFSGMQRVERLEVGGWDTSKVTDMSGMFKECRVLRDVAVSGWDTSKVTNMANMFNDCRSLEHINNGCWDTSKVTDMSAMFSDCDSLEDIEDGRLDMSSVTSTESMFYHCKRLRLMDIAGWDVSNVESMGAMFCGCENIETLEVEGWNVAKVEAMFAMFAGTKVAMLDLSAWKTPALTTCEEMFCGCGELASLDVSGVDVKNVGDLSRMFMDCKVLQELDLSMWNTGKATSMNGMFSGCGELMSLNVSNFDTAKVTDMSSMFTGCSSITSLTLGEGFGRTKTVKEIDFSYMGKWTNSTVQTLLTLYDRKANGLALLTLKLSPATAAALGEDGKATLEGKGYAVEVVDRGTEKSYLVI